MLAAACVLYGKTPSEIRSLPRSERAFMYAAMMWKNEEESSANARTAQAIKRKRQK